jgi:hypothetical protein
MLVVGKSSDQGCLKSTTTDSAWGSSAFMTMTCSKEVPSRRCVRQTLAALGSAVTVWCLKLKFSGAPRSFMASSMRTT